MEEKIRVYYDGSCGFCNRSVQFILKNRASNDFLFSPLQSESAKRTLTQSGIEIDMSTLYIKQGASIKTKSKALLSLIGKLKWYWFWLRIAYIIPNGLRDKIYDTIAKRRHKIAGKFCYLPSKEERAMFKMN